MTSPAQDHIESIIAHVLKRELGLASEFSLELARTVVDDMFSTVNFTCVNELLYEKVRETLPTKGEYKMSNYVLKTIGKATVGEKVTFKSNDRFLLGDEIELQAQVPTTSKPYGTGRIVAIHRSGLDNEPDDLTAVRVE